MKRGLSILAAAVALSAPLSAHRNLIVTGGTGPIDPFDPVNRLPKHSAQRYRLTGNRAKRHRLAMAFEAMNG